MNWVLTDILATSAFIVGFIIRLATERINFPISTTGQTKIETVRCKLTLYIRQRRVSVDFVSALVIILADPEFTVSKKIEIILGPDVYELETVLEPSEFYSFSMAPDQPLLGLLSIIYCIHLLRRHQNDVPPGAST